MYISGLLLAVLGLVCGITIDWSNYIAPAFMISSFYLLAFCAAVFTWKTMRCSSVLTLLALIFFSTRIAFFPTLVISGYFASLGNYAVWAVSGIELPYCFFLPAFLLLSCIFCVLMQFLSIPKVRVLSFILLLWCGAISFSAAEDLRFFSEKLYRPTLSQSMPDCERKNNHYLALLQNDTPPLRSFLLINAGITYSLIPPAPWGAQVRDDLACLTLKNPEGSSLDRLEEHFRVFVKVKNASKGSG